MFHVNNMQPCTLNTCVFGLSLYQNEIERAALAQKRDFCIHLYCDKYCMLSLTNDFKFDLHILHIRFAGTFTDES